MGCDGGTIPKRDELVKVKKKPEKKDQHAELSFQWRCCSLTQEILEEPIVTCGYGKLYNKESLIGALLNRSLLPKSLKYIKSLKDIKDLTLTPNPEYVKGAEKSDGALDSRAFPFICPIIGLEMNGKFRFVCLWSCGCVMSERAIKEISSSVCPKCQIPFTRTSIVFLNASEEDMKLMKNNLKSREALRQAAKKPENKKIKEEIKDEEGCASNYSVNLNSASSSKSGAKFKIPEISTQNTKHKLKNNDVLMDPEIKKIKTNYSVAKDPKATDVYKTLFTSHQSEKKQNRAHWVTYNPFYN